MAMLLQQGRALLQSDCLRIERHHLPRAPDRCREEKGVTAFSCGQIDSQVAMGQDLADQFMTPCDDTG
jgi:hypothetical protein